MICTSTARSPPPFETFRNSCRWTVSPGPRSKDPQELALAVGDANDMHAALQLAALDVERERPEADRLDGRRLRLRAAAEDAGDAQQQLARLERLRQIVVGADLEPADAVSAPPSARSGSGSARTRSAAAPR